MHLQFSAMGVGSRTPECKSHILYCAARKAKTHISTHRALFRVADLKRKFRAPWSAQSRLQNPSFGKLQPSFFVIVKVLQRLPCCSHLLMNMRGIARSDIAKHRSSCAKASVGAQRMQYQLHQVKVSGDGKYGSESYRSTFKTLCTHSKFASIFYKQYLCLSQQSLHFCYSVPIPK